MVKSKEWSKKFREEVISLHKQGYGYKKMAKRLNISRDTIGSIVRKFKAKGTVETLPGRGRKRLLSATAVRYLRRKVEKNPRVTAEELRQDMSKGGIQVSAQTIRRTLRNDGFHARTPRRTRRVDSSMPKTMWTNHKGFGILFSGVMRPNWNFLGQWINGTCGGERMMPIKKRTPCLL